jgi:hypothetical protein
MDTKTIGCAALLCAIVSPLFAAPSLNITPAGFQSGNLVWDVSITPDLNLADGGSTALAAELGFTLTGGSLLSVSNINATAFDTGLPGTSIFGWEITYPEDNNNPESIEANCTSCSISNPISADHPSTIVFGHNNQIFVSMGSVVFSTPGPKPFLQIVATGPAGGSSGSTIEWRGAYGPTLTKGRITQSTGPFSTTNFDIYAGSATQSVPEPGCAMLLFAAVFVLPMRRYRGGRGR